LGDRILIETASYDNEPAAWRVPVLTGDKGRFTLVAGVEDARRALRAVDGGADRKADLVDEASP
jgi:hypothetical protein